ncbi:MAG: peptidoglycan DD-metalloendopeptidase family protein [Candidatus Krumholzibacteriia bacterium]
MENDKLKSIVLATGSIILLFLVATNPGLQKDAIWHASKTSGDSVDVAAAAKAPQFAGIVSRNMSFFDLMIKCGLDAPSIKLIEKAARNVYDFRRIYPGQRYEVYAGEDGNIESMQFSVGDTSYIDINIKDGDISAEKKDYEFSTRLKTASGTITNSLYLACKEQGIPADVGDQLANIFAWDINFWTDMQRGDYFKVIYEERIRFDGMKKVGRIVAAEFNTQGRGHYAFMFKNEDGKQDYYDENGKSLRKQLLKAPLTYSRISSNFSHRRFHPVLHHFAPHLGIDYAAPIGTPVMATGDAAVIETGRNSANGKYIKLRHSNGYTTYYLHLSRFAKGMHPGARVRQGEVIGYVGMTGYATGPHLDYRVKKGNTFVNPRKISLPPAQPVTNASMASFIDLRDRHLARLSSVRADVGAANVAATASPTGAEKGTLRGESSSSVSH